MYGEANAIGEADEGVSVCGAGMVKGCVRKGARERQHGRSAEVGGM